MVRAFSSLPQFNCPKIAHNLGGPYRACTCSALTTNGMLTDQHTTAAEIDLRSLHLQAHTTEERVRTPYVSNVLPPYDNMAIARRSEVVSTVVSTYPSLTTYATRVACGPRTPCATVNVTCFFSALAAYYPSLQKKRRERDIHKTRTDKKDARRLVI